MGEVACIGAQGVYVSQRPSVPKQSSEDEQIWVGWSTSVAGAHDDAALRIPLAARRKASPAKEERCQLVTRQL